MARWMLIVVGVLVALGVAIYGAGVVLPRAHVARMEGVVAKAPAEVAVIIRDVRAYPTWRHGVVVEDIAEEASAVTYVEVVDEDRIAYRLTEPVRDVQFVATMTDASLPFGGSWTITLTPEGAGTRVRIEEDGEVRDPVYRFFAHFIFGYTSSMKSYLESLGAADVAASGASLSDPGL